MSDVLITRDGPYDAPYSYELGAREAFEPTTVEGLVDGAGAGGSFKIVCVIRSPDGKVLARVPTSETFSPGDEVAVTFAPFLRGTPAASVTTQSWLRVVAGPAVPSGSIPLQSGTQMTIADFDTNDSARFTQTSAAQWTMTRGAYIINGQLRETTGSSVTANGDFSVGINSFSGFALYAFGANLSNVLTVAFAGMTIGDQSSFTSWRLLACGADTNAWVGEVDIVHVLGT